MEPAATGSAEGTATSDGGAAPDANEYAQPNGNALLAELQAAEAAEAKTAGDPAEKPETDITAKPAEVDPNAKPLTDEEKAAKLKADEEAAAALAAKPPEATDTPEIKKARSIFAAAARKEASALAAQRATKALEAEVTSLKATLAKAHEDPLSVLQALGFGNGAEKDPVKDLLRKVVAQGEPKVQTADERVAALEAKLAERDTKAQQEAESAAITNAQAQVTSIVRAAGEKFDLVNAFDAHDMVWDTMVEYHATHGTPCTPQQAAEYVEKTIAAKLGKSTKFKAPAGAPAAKAADKPATPSTGPKATSTATARSETLTNTELGTTQEPEELPMDHRARARAVSKELGIPYAGN